MTSPLSCPKRAAKAGKSQLTSKHEPAQQSAQPLTFKETLLWIAYLVSLVWLFYPGLIDSQVPAFRDAYHFYYPQAVWLDRCAQRGEYFPAWNADEGLGVSVAGQPSAALYYPLRIFWFTPWLSVAQRFSLIIVVHLIIAALGIRFAACKFKLSRDAGWLAAMSYSLSCPVFFQHTNLIYLCSAAWIGFALGSVWDLLQSPHPVAIRCCLVFSAACSLMVLAGDAHTAVNTFIVGGLLFMVCSVSRQTNSKFVARAQFKTLWLSSALFIVTVVTAIQWIPTIHWVQHSVRSQATSITPIATTELDLKFLQTSQKSGRIYDFSLSPWHLATCMWPTLGGHYLPNNSRLFAAIPAEGRMWLPAIYFGLFPALLCLHSLLRRRVLVTDTCWKGWLALQKSETWPARCLVIMATFSILAALGNYSIVWLLRESCDWFGLDRLSAKLPKDHVGGLYALLVAVLPGYKMFRYPAKWTVWFVASCSLLAGLTLDARNMSEHKLLSPRLCRIMSTVSLLGLLGSIGFALSAGARGDVDAWLTNATRDVWLGSVNSSSLAISLYVAMGVPVVLLVLALRRQSSHFLLWLTILEMTVCSSCWISFTKPDRVRDIDFPTTTASRPFVWSNTAAADFRADGLGPGESLADAYAGYQDSFMLGKLALLANARSLGASQSIEPQAISALRTWLSSRDQLTRSQPELDKVLRQFGVTHRLLRTRRDSQPAEFEWIAIDNPAPLCELLVDLQTTQQVGPSLNWQWPSSGQLDIEIKAQSDCVVQVRQFNDGGWEAKSDTDATLSIDPQPFFIRISVPNKTTRVLLRRKWFM